jgi:hypothetical protein
MKKHYNYTLLILALLVSALCITPAAMATAIGANDWVTLKSWNSIDSAGIMTYAVSHTSNGPTVGTYDTFCIQDNVYIYANTSYLVKDISGTVGKFEPSSPKGSNKPINGGVDYLFYLFESGKYDAQLYAGPNMMKNQADLQYTFWNLQGTYDGSSPFSIMSNTAWANDLKNYNNQALGLQHSWGTQVLNIVDASGHGVQNQLYNQVPEPGTMLLFGSGLLALAGFRRFAKK